MTSLLQNTRRPDISFHANGRIDIAARAVRLLGIQPGDVIDIVHDGIEYYLRIQLRAHAAVGRHEGQCFPTSRRGKAIGSYRAYSRRLATAIINLASPHADAVRLPCGNIVEVNSQKFLPIITRRIL